MSASLSKVAGTLFVVRFRILAEREREIFIFVVYVGFHFTIFFQLLLILYCLICLIYSAVFMYLIILMFDNSLRSSVFKTDSQLSVAKHFLSAVLNHGITL